MFFGSCLFVYVSADQMHSLTMRVMLKLLYEVDGCERVQFVSEFLEGKKRNVFLGPPSTFLFR